MEFDASGRNPKPASAATNVSFFIALYPPSLMLLMRSKAFKA
jgi:hypothetical protein